MALTPEQTAAVSSWVAAGDNLSALLLAPLVVARKGFYTDLAKWAGVVRGGDIKLD